MNCQKASSLLSAYLDRELTVEERREIRLHLMHCDECHMELEELEEIKDALGYLNAGTMPSILPWLRANLADGSIFSEEDPIFVWQQSWFRRTCAVAVLLLLFGLSSWLILPQRRSEPAEPGGFPSLPDSRVIFSRFGR
ncbi:MAG: anti-sigma factor family protein [Bacteroidota bacterium]